MPFVRAPFFHFVFAQAAARCDGPTLGRLLASALRRGPLFPAAILEAAGHRYEALGDARRAGDAYRAAAIVEPSLQAHTRDAVRTARPGGDWSRRLAVHATVAGLALREYFAKQPQTAFGAVGHYAALRGVAELADPELYLEIGSNYGESLDCFKRARRMIAIDPAPKFPPSRFPNLEFHKDTSDAYFDRVLAGENRPAPDVVFVDGLHESDQVLRDFVNAEALARPGAIVLLHDVMPVDPRTATKVRRYDFWLGDCWRALHFIAHHRRDLEIGICPVRPSGLALVRLGDAPRPIPLEDFQEHADRLSLERDFPPLMLRLRWVEPSWASVARFLDHGTSGRDGYGRFALSADDALMLMACRMAPATLDVPTYRRLHLVWAPERAGVPRH